MRTHLGVSGYSYKNLNENEYELKFIINKYKILFKLTSVCSIGSEYWGTLFILNNYYFLRKSIWVNSVKILK